MLTTVRKRESLLTEEERRRNSRGPTLVFVSRHHFLARQLARGVFHVWRPVANNFFSSFVLLRSSTTAASCGCRDRDGIGGSSRD